MKKNYELTIKAAFAGYVVQAIVNNFLPLLFVQMQNEFDIPLSQITLLISVNFFIQLLIDLGSTPVIDRIGYRASMILSNAFVIAGLALLTILPGILGDPFTGVLTAVCVYAIGGGLQEVLVSPIVEGCPTKNKETTMSLLHSAYCWGHVAVVLISTLFFKLAGIDNWRILSALWCIIPLADLILFTFVPIIEPGDLSETTGEEESQGAKDPLKEKDRTGLSDLIRRKIFWVMLLMMLCAGASEQAVSQWASAFAEKGIGVSKQMGDLLGPMLFAICMGTSRTIYGIKGHRIDLRKFMNFSVILCVISYLGIIIVRDPILSLLGCALTGMAVGIFWPGTFSMAASGIKNGGTLMFALLALAGDLGCSGGPAFSGIIMSLYNGNMRAGIGAAIVFPILMGLGLRISKMTGSSDDGSAKA